MRARASKQESDTGELGLPLILHKQLAPRLPLSSRSGCRRTLVPADVRKSTSERLCRVPMLYAFAAEKVEDRHARLAGAKERAE